jgi:hypothetical protein
MDVFKNFKFINHINTTLSLDVTFHILFIHEMVPKKLQTSITYRGFINTIWDPD